MIIVNKYRYWLLIFLSTLAINITTSNAQNSEYSVPERVEFIPENEDHLITYLSPIGWSKNGKFAYVTEPADEACGCYFFEIAIIDLVTDKLLWKWKLQGESERESKNETKEAVWQKNIALFSRKLNEFEIIQQTDFVLESVNFVSGVNDYNLNINTEKNNDSEFKSLKSLKVEITSQELGWKTVSSAEFTEYSLILSAGLSGHFESPFEDRIAIIYYLIKRGYEGPPNVINFKISGSHLTAGFKKHNQR